MGAGKEQARRIPLTQPPFGKKEGEEKRRLSTYGMVQLHFHHLGGRVGNY